MRIAVQSILFIACLMASTLIGAHAQWGHKPPQMGQLNLNRQSGPAPFTVVLNGPSSFLNVARATRGGWGMGVPYALDWGDGNRSLDSENNFTGSHTYNVPGVYQIKASLLQWTPDDLCYATWEAMATITVTAYSSSNSAPHLKISNFAAGKEYPQDQYPEFTIDLLTNTRSSLVAEMFDETNTVIASCEDKDFSYSDPNRKFVFSPRDCSTVYAALKKYGKRKCHLQLQLKDKSGKVLATATTPSFYITPVISKDWSKLHDATIDQIECGSSVYPVGSGRGGSVIPAVAKNKNPLSVKLRYIATFKYGCSYILDWGDGTAPLKRILNKGVKPAGLMEQDTLYFDHTYAKPGKYLVKFKTTDHEPNGQLEDIFSYETLELNVGR